MKRRTQQEWLSLFQQHEQSGLTAAEFCREHHLNAKYFSKRKWDLNWKAKSSRATQSFIRVSRPERKSSPSSIQLTVGQAQLNLPESIDTNWLAMLVKALA
jgi:hypothetical protein